MVTHLDDTPDVNISLRHLYFFLLIILTVLRLFGIQVYRCIQHSVIFVEMPLEDEIIPDDKQGANRGEGLQNFLDSAQNALTEAVAKSAAEKAVDNMFSSGQHANRGGGPPQEGLYPDINRDNNRHQDPSIMDTAQNAFADAFAKRAAERLVDGILPSNNPRPEGNYGPPAEHARSQAPEHSGFDLGKLGSSLLESLTDQVLHPSDKQNPQQQHHSQQQQQMQGQGKEQQEQPGFDLGSMGSQLLSSLTEQVLHPNKAQPEQLQTSARPSQIESDNQSGFDFSKVGSELLGSLAQQVLHPADKKVAEQQQQQLPPSQDSNKPDFDIGKVGAELLGSLAEQVLHPSDKKEDVQPQSRNHDNLENQPKPHSLADTAGDIASSVLGSLAESVLHKNSNNETQQYQGPNNYGPFPQGPGPQWYPPQGYRPGPEGYGPGPYAYGPGPQGYWPGPQGYGPPPQGYGPGPQGYWPPQEGYGPNPQPPPHPNPKNEQSAEDVGSMLLNTVAGAVRQNPAPSQDHHQRKQPEEDESSASELGSFLVNSLASKMLQPHH